MKLVVDASIDVKMILQEHNSSKALKVCDEFRRGIHQLITPDLYFLEIGNVLVMAARKGKIPKNDLPLFYADLIRHQPLVFPFTSLFPEAFSIASQIRVSIYDAIYLALAEQQCCALLTDDAKLINAAHGLSTMTLDSL